MNKQAYLAALKRALSGLPAELTADILRDYDQHFIDAMASGRSDAQTASALGDPRKVALEFKAMTHLDAFQHKRSLANFGRMAFALVCMAGFNLFLLPFMLVAPLMLLVFYLASACLFLAGATVAASGVTGIDKLAFEFGGRPMALLVRNEADPSSSEHSKGWYELPVYGVHLVGESMMNSESVLNGIAPSDGSDKLPSGAVYIAGGILLFLFSQKLAGFVGAGTRRYLHANASLLRGAQKAAG